MAKIVVFFHGVRSGIDPFVLDFIWRGGFAAGFAPPARAILAGFGWFSFGGSRFFRGFGGASLSPDFLFASFLIFPPPAAAAAAATAPTVPFLFIG